MALKHVTKKAVEKVKKDNEKGARRTVLEDLFYDFHKSRAEVYKMNFIRGIFLGLGTAIGGTIVVALIIWLLSFFVHLPGVGDSVQQIQQTLESAKK